MADGFELQAKQCATCIYRKDSLLNIKALEAEIADPSMKGHFRSYRICHHSTTACCRGFWNRHKDDCDTTQLAQRLDVVVEVNHDRLKRS